MNWLDKLERKFGKYAIHNLMYYIIILYILGLVIQMVNPSLYTQWLGLDAEAILHGQIWRIVTFIIQPPNASFLFMAFALYFYYMVGQALEYMWGAFRFNLYFFSGVLLHVIACLVIYLIFGINFSMGTFYLNLSLFFVYAYLFPDATFLLFFIFPIKAKWLGIIEGIFYGTDDHRRFVRTGESIADVYHARHGHSGNSCQQHCSVDLTSELCNFCDGQQAESIFAEGY